MKKLLVLIALVSLMGCLDLNVNKGAAHRALLDNIPQEKELSFETKEDISALATANMEKSAQVHYEGTEAKSEESEFIWQASIRIAGILGINTDFDPNDPESLKKILSKGTDALEEKNKQIDDLKTQVKDFEKKVLAANEEYQKEKKRSGGLVTWIWRLIWALVILFVIQILTGLPVFTGTLSLLKKLGKQTVAGIQKFREDLKKRAAEGDEAAREQLARLDSRLDEAQDPKVKLYIKKLKNGE